MYAIYEIVTFKINQYYTLYKGLFCCCEKVIPISFNDHQLFCKISFLLPFDI